MPQFATSYDQLPYTPFTFAHTHPDRLATVGRLYGVESASPQNCRVLELGCATGSNLVPMAEQLRHSQFLGIDLSPRQIEVANARAADLNLSNVRFRAQDIAEFPTEEGEFDYIICHGVFSWVPDNIRHKILEICSKQLSPQGIAFISYNAYPGWHLRSIVRDMMRHSTRNVVDVKQRIANARTLLEFLSQSVPEKTAYGQMLRNEAAHARSFDDSAFYHDQLAELNVSFYFHEFLEHLGPHDLRYIADAEPRLMYAFELQDDVRRQLNTIDDLLEREQFYDFLRNTSFRRSLVAKKGCVAKPAMEPAAMRELYISSYLKPVGTIHLASGQSETFATASKVQTSTHHFVTKSLLLHLARPENRRIPVQQAISYAIKIADSTEAPANSKLPAETLLDFLFQLYLRAAVDLYSRPADFVSEISDRPAARPLARLQARQGALVTNLLHDTIKVTPAARELLPSLDGSHTGDQLLAVLENLPAAKSQDAAELLQSTLEFLANAAVLVG